MMFSNNQTMMMRNRITVRARPVLVGLKLLVAVLVVMQFSASALSLTSRNTAGGILPRPQRQQGLLRDDDGIRATSEPRRMLGRTRMATKEEEEDKEQDDAAAAAAPVAAAVTPAPATDDAEVDKAIATLAAGDGAEDDNGAATASETVDEAAVLEDDAVVQAKEQEEEKEPEEAPKQKPKEEYQIKKMSDKGKKFFGDEVGAMAPVRETRTWRDLTTVLLLCYVLLQYCRYAFMVPTVRCVLSFSLMPGFFLVWRYLTTVLLVCYVVLCYVMLCYVAILSVGLLYSTVRCVSFLFLSCRFFFGVSCLVVFVTPYYLILAGLLGSARIHVGWQSCEIW